MSTGTGNRDRAWHTNTQLNVAIMPTAYSACYRTSTHENASSCPHQSSGKSAPLHSSIL